LQSEVGNHRLYIYKECSVFFQTLGFHLIKDDLPVFL
jgi:hypothetical protein